MSPRSPFTDRNRPGPSHGRHRGRLAAAALGTAVVLAGLTGCAPGSGPDADGVTTLDFFQFKPEAVQDFADIITDFEAENPDIRVVQNAVPDADTAIRTLLVKNKVPDVLTLNVSGNFAELARACVFADLADEPSADTVNPAVQEIVQDLGSCDQGDGQEVNALPFANNASGIIYNPDIFAAQGVEVPTTWTELIAAADTFEQAGIAPFYCTMKDAWTAGPAFVNLGGALMPDGFFDDLRAEGCGGEAAAVLARPAVLASGRTGGVGSGTHCAPPCAGGAAGAAWVVLVLVLGRAGRLLGIQEVRVGDS